MNWVLIVTIFLGNQTYPQPAHYFNSEEECKVFLPKHQEKVGNLQIVGKCYEIKGEIDYE